MNSGTDEVLYNEQRSCSRRTYMLFNEKGLTQSASSRPPVPRNNTDASGVLKSRLPLMLSHVEVLPVREGMSFCATCLKRYSLAQHNPPQSL